MGRQLYHLITDSHLPEPPAHCKEGLTPRCPREKPGGAGAAQRAICSLSRHIHPGEAGQGRAGTMVRSHSETLSVWKGRTFGPGPNPWRKAWQPTPVMSPGESHGQRSLAGYGPWHRIGTRLKRLSTHACTHKPPRPAST